MRHFGHLITVRSQGVDAVPLQTRCALRPVALSRGLPRTGLGVRVLATLATAAVVTSCDSQSRNPQLEWGWVTNCTGPEFNKVSQDSGSSPGPDRPVFKINDQFVLAVPKKNRPYANKLDHEPRECKKISDLPPVVFLAFVFAGTSSGDKPQDVPMRFGPPRR